jgi:hypothetical protein
VAKTATEAINNVFRMEFHVNNKFKASSVAKPGTGATV